MQPAKGSLRVTVLEQESVWTHRKSEHTTNVTALSLTATHTVLLAFSDQFGSRAALLHVDMI